MLDINFINKIPKTDQPIKSESLPKIFGVEAKENYISNWIAYILDPARFNSSAPLISFLRLLNEREIIDTDIFIKAIDDINDEDMTISNINVYREASLQKDGRIDILIEIKLDKSNLIIGIENKLHSFLYHEQINRYTNSFDKKYKESNYTVIAIAPSWYSKQLNELNYSLTYEDLAKNLSNVPINNLDSRQYFILIEFIKYIEDYIKGDAYMLNHDWASFNSNNADKLEEIYSNGVQQLKIFSEIIENSIKNEIIEKSNVCEGINGEWTTNKQHKTIFFIQLKNDIWDEHGIHIEIGKEDDFNTHRFILPPKLILTLDFEKNETQNIVRKKFNIFNGKELKVASHKNERDYFVLEKYTMNYSNQENINIEITDMLNKIGELIPEVDKLVTEIIKIKNSNVPT